MLQRIATNNSDDTLLLNAIDFEYQDHRVKVVGSNEQIVYYSLQRKQGTAKRSYRIGNPNDPGHGVRIVETIDFNTPVLTKVTGKHLQTTDYDHLSFSNFENAIFTVLKVKNPEGRGFAPQLGPYERIENLHLLGENQPLYTFEYHSSHTTVKDALGREKRYRFHKRRLSEVEEDHRTQNYSWDKLGQLTTHTLIDTRKNCLSKREYQYDEQGNIIQVTLTGTITQPKPEQDTYQIKYFYSKDGRNLLLKETHNHDKEYLYTYQPNTNLLTSKLTLVNQAIVEREFNDYDKNGILICKIIDDGSGESKDDLTQVTYRKITEITPHLTFPGLTHPHIVKEFFLQNGQKVPLKKIERLYQSTNLLAEERVFDSNEQYRYSLYYEYNSQRKLIRETNALGEVTLYNYDPNGNKIYEEKVGTGKKLHFVYDNANRLIQEMEEHPDKTLITQHTYDPMGNRISTKDHFGQVTTYQYDAANRLICEIDPLGKSELKKYNAKGYIISQTDKDGYKTKTAVNLYGSPLTIHHPDKTTKQFAYNLQGHLIQEWQRDGTQIDHQVDYQGRPTATHNYSPEGVHLKTTQYVYKGPNLIAEIDPLGNTTTYQYDGAGRQTAKIQGGITTTYTYDSLNRLFKTTCGERVDIKEYDYLDRLIEEKVEDLSEKIFSKVQYAYDIRGNQGRKREYTDLQNFSETITLYNSENLPVLEIDPLGYQKQIRYRQTDHLEKEIIDPNGRLTLEVYNPLNQLQEVKIFCAGANLHSHTTFAYDGRGNKTLHQDHILHNNIYIGTYSIETTYDEIGQKLSETEQGNKTTHYTYQLGRLHTIQKPDGVDLAPYLGPLFSRAFSFGLFLFQFHFICKFPRTESF